jgi:hypothetical protein
MYTRSQLEAMYEDEQERINFRRKVGGKYTVKRESIEIKQELSDISDEARDSINE